MLACPDSFIFYADIYPAGPVDNTRRYEFCEQIYSTRTR